MKLRHYYQVLTGKSKALDPAKIDLKHIWAVIQSWFRSIFPAPRHIKEQIIWRRGQVCLKSPSCWNEGHCIYCGCIIIEKTKADMACESEPACYPVMMSKKEWKIFKETNNIKLF